VEMAPKGVGVVEASVEVEASEGVETPVAVAEEEDSHLRVEGSEAVAATEVAATATPLAEEASAEETPDGEVSS
jgi:hypothetical protein